MRWTLLLSLVTAVLFQSSFGLQAQANPDLAHVQEDFALAVATAHARTSLFGAGMQPFAIHASVTSSLALRGTGQGTYDNQWADAKHWRRVISFPDFHQTEMRNDEGHAWTDTSSAAMPLRIAELLRVVVIHVPGSTTAAKLPVTQTSMTGEDGEPLVCYAAVAPPTSDGFQRQARWCFNKATGLLASQDMPLNTHIVYRNYVEFQGKHEFTQVRVTSGALPVLDIHIQYALLDPHALENAVPDSTMTRSESAGSTPNPEELHKGTVEYFFAPPIPPGTAAADAKKPVQIQFHVGADNKVLDACVEEAPTEAMAQAALEGARKFTFTPQTIDGTPAANRFYYSVWFREGDAPKADASATDPAKANAAPSAQASSGLYQSLKPAFTLHYPTDFEPVPRGKLDQDLHLSKGPHHYGLDPGAQCNTLLFKAQRLPAGQHSPEVLSVYDLSSLCIFGTLDHKALENIASNAAKSVVAQWDDGSIASPKQYMANGRFFVVVSASGMSRSAIPERTHVIFVTTKINDEVVGWMLAGGEAEDRLAEALASCTLEIGEQRIPLLPQ